MTGPFKVTRTWFIEADGPLDAIEKTKSGSGVPHDKADARPQVEGYRDPSITVVEVPEPERGAWHYTQPIEVLDLAYDDYMAQRLERGDPMHFMDLLLAIAVAAYRQAHEEEEIT